MIDAIRRHEIAARDQAILTLLHHILFAHRFWIHACQGLPFAMECESRVPGSLDAILSMYQETQKQEREWLAQLSEADLTRTVESAFLPGRRIPVREGLLQVCLHSQGHRSQCAARLKQLGGAPPGTDYIVWTKDRPMPPWD